MNTEIEFARRAAIAAGENALRIRREGFATETKADTSPVTRADRSNEALIRAMIEREFPGDGIFGEEGSRKPGTSGRRWIVDPIDGTRDFVRGNRFWCVLLALEAADGVLAGVAHFPSLGETYHAARGMGSYRNGERLWVSSIATIGQAVFSPNGMHQMASGPYAPAIMDFAARSWAVRSFGGALDACLLAAGQIDVWLEPKAEVWDLAPLQVIIEEAGGIFFALDGSRRPDAGNAAATTPALEKDVRAFFGVPDPPG
jgi:histidinol-phosphatase